MQLDHALEYDSSNHSSYSSESGYNDDSDGEDDDLSIPQKQPDPVIILYFAIRPIL